MSYERRTIARVDAPGVSAECCRHDQGVELLPHEHTEPVMHVVLMGVYEERIEGRVHGLPEGSVLYKPASCRHSNRFSVGSTTLRLRIEPGWLGGRGLGDVFSDPRSESANPGIAVLARGLVEELRSPDRFTPLSVEAACLRLAAHLARGEAKPATGPGPRALADRAAKLLRERCTDHSEPALTLSSLAQELGAEPWALARAFRRRHGMSVGAFARATRLEWFAGRLRDTDEPISILAGRAGFADQSHATRAFQAAFGMPPGAYRRTAR